MNIAGIDHDPGRRDALKEWVHTYWEAVHPFNHEGGYINFNDGRGCQGGV